MNASHDNRSMFAGYHPLVNFLYFAYVIVMTAFYLQPVYLIISFVSALAYSIYLNHGHSSKWGYGLVVILMIVSILINPAFNHRGVTIITYVGYNPITLEAVLYGLAMATMIGAVVLWFMSYNIIMSSDKFIYLFGRIMPSVSLIISMALRFIPHYRDKIKKISSARRGIGFDASSGSFLTRVKNGSEILSIMVTWALENGIETADSMKARGYGLKGRSAYSNYRFDTRDLGLVCSLLLLMTVPIAAAISGASQTLFFPELIVAGSGWYSIAAYVCHALICVLPLALEVREDIMWSVSLGRLRTEDDTGTSTSLHAAKRGNHEAF